MNGNSKNTNNKFNKLSNIYSPNGYARYRLWNHDLQNRIMTKVKGRCHNFDSEVVISQSIPTTSVTIW